MIKIGKNISEFSAYSCKPTTKNELKDIIRDRIKEQGPNCDLNDIDTSLIEDMSYLFYKSKFNGDISNWNVRNVENMSSMFNSSCFNDNLSNWDVRNVTDMCAMFYDTYFDKDISNWKINRKCNTLYVFDLCLIKEEYKPKSLQK